MEGMEDKLKSIRDKFDQFEMKDNFNMDEPRCFKNVNLNSLNCEYRANKRAWMTGVLLIKELGYRNAMDVEDVLTHPEENVVAQSTMKKLLKALLELIKMISMKKMMKVLQW
ncbi:hypothetical protein Tco_0398856, partial [Tanacetum coccineum]